METEVTALVFLGDACLMLCIGHGFKIWLSVLSNYGSGRALRISCLYCYAYIKNDIKIEEIFFQLLEF